MTKTTISIPDPCLVVLVGSEDWSRKAFAAKHFAEHEIFSVSQGATSDDVTANLRKRIMTVVEAPNLTFGDRLAWYNIAKELHTASAVIVVAPQNNALDKPLEIVRRAMRSIRKGEGVCAHAVVSSPKLDDVEIVRHELPSDMRKDSGPFDIIGDVHGCRDELEELLFKLGWNVTWYDTGTDRRPQLSHPEGRKIILLGDIVDRGPYSVDALLMAESIVEAGVGYVVMGNHDERLRRWLDGHKIKVSYGLDQTIADFDGIPAEITNRLKMFLTSLPSHLVVDGGALIAAHAGLASGMALGTSHKVDQFAIFGPRQTNDAGVDERVDWAREYNDDATVVYGHMSQESALWRNNTICIDTSCVFGGELTALRWPERELVSVPAHATYHPRERDADDMPPLEPCRSP